jgi:hypothetical protein
MADVMFSISLCNPKEVLDYLYLVLIIFSLIDLGL